jgi:hypothetical protein
MKNMEKKMMKKYVLRCHNSFVHFFYIYFLYYIFVLVLVVVVVAVVALSTSGNCLVNTNDGHASQQRLKGKCEKKIYLLLSYCNK